MSVLERIRGKLVVSVQASGDEPLNRPEILCAMAESVLSGGAAGVRMAQEENIRYFRQRHPDVPVIGIEKPHVIPENAHELVYITPGWADVGMLAPCCDIVALDATLRRRPGKETLSDIVSNARRYYPELRLMADVATLEEGLHAARLGFDLISTTLSGYTTETLAKAASGPDFELLSALIARVDVPVVLEGRVWEPEQMAEAFRRGAFSVVIGSAITRPHEITRRFARQVPVPLS